MQKRISPKFFLPRCLKGNPFNYYHDVTLDIIKANEYNSECIICLDELVKVDDNSVQADSESKFSYDKLQSLLRNWVESLKRINVRKPYMITPCRHVFHSACLESWMSRKNECAFCRREIPPIE